MKGKEYAATYQLGRTVVHVVPPPPMTKEELEKCWEAVYAAAWALIDELVERGEDV